MVHASAALTPRARLTVARLVVDQKVPIAEVAARFQCSWPTVKRWAERYAAGQSMQDRSSRPRRMPGKTGPATTRRIVSLRLRKRLGPVQLAALTGVAPSTAHRVLTRCGLNRLSHVDRARAERGYRSGPPARADHRQRHRGGVAARAAGVGRSPRPVPGQQGPAPGSPVRPTAARHEDHRSHRRHTAARPWQQLPVSPGRRRCRALVLLRRRSRAIPALRDPHPLRFEIRITYTNGDVIQATFGSSGDAVDFLRTFV